VPGSQDAAIAASPSCHRPKAPAAPKALA
jgi:hypothetical protein